MSDNPYVNNYNGDRKYQDYKDVNDNKINSDNDIIDNENCAFDGEA